MDQATKVVTRGWVDMLIGTILLAGALVALCFPVYLDSYDKWGLQIKCGNGYYSQLLQATVDDQEQAHPSGSATNYVGQCKSALAHRRAWTISIAGLGALILVPELVAWGRGGSRRPEEPIHQVPEEAPDPDLHNAAQLDRRYRSHRPPSHDTTL